MVFIRRTEARAPSKPNFDKTLETILRFFDDKVNSPLTAFNITLNDSLKNIG
jgi:hypothetical protein